MDAGWVDDTKLWPKLQRPFVYNYMVEMPDTDGKPSVNYRGFAEGSNLLDSGHVGVALYQQKNGVKCIKANIRSSQTVCCLPLPAACLDAMVTEHQVLTHHHDL
ncbi:hypothetical protein V5799_016511 [Amblyomma americanum]|uniref:Uncharacterized protein n=1 Tax=Amblyomma americanum TaxID=6943 RepID=A0AAQ4F665_AMBAM